MSKEHFLNTQGVVDTLESDTKILGLFGKYLPLSNFHMESVKVGGRVFRCSEAAYMSEKTDDGREKDILTQLNGLEAKHYGQTVTLRPNWDKVKYDRMFLVVLAKFHQCDYLKELLLSTGDKYIEETNWWRDHYWGVCNRVGQNKLGHILMLTRDSLK